jgi:hypothetical protein
VGALFIEISPFQVPVIPDDRSHFAAVRVPAQWSGSGLGLFYDCSGNLLKIRGKIRFLFRRNDSSGCMLVALRRWQWAHSGEFEVITGDRMDLRLQR